MHSKNNIHDTSRKSTESPGATNDRPLVPPILSGYRLVNPTKIQCQFCQGTVYFGKGRSNEPTLPATVYACHCAYFSAKQLGTPSETEWRHEVERMRRAHRPLEAKQEDSQLNLLFADEADKVRTIHRELTGMGKTMIERMIEASEILTRIKQGLPHGAWMPWVEMHIAEVSHRTINRYMRTYSRRNDPLLQDDPVRFIAEISGNVGKLESGELSHPEVTTNSELLLNSTSTSNLDTESETPSTELPNHDKSDKGIADEINRLHREYCATQETVQSFAPKIKQLSQTEKLSDEERKKLAECEAVIERGLPEAIEVMEAIDRLSPFKINRDLEIEANRLFIAFISNLSNPLKRAVARIMLGWAQEYLNVKRDGDFQG